MVRRLGSPAVLRDTRFADMFCTLSTRLLCSGSCYAHRRSNSDFRVWKRRSVRRIEQLSRTKESGYWARYVPLRRYGVAARDRVRFACSPAWPAMRSLLGGALWAATVILRILHARFGSSVLSDASAPRQTTVWLGHSPTGHAVARNVPDNGVRFEYTFAADLVPHSRPQMVSVVTGFHRRVRDALDPLDSQGREWRVVLEAASQARTSVTFRRVTTHHTMWLSFGYAFKRITGETTRHDQTHFHLSLPRTVLASSPQNGAFESGPVAPTFAVDLGYRSGRGSARYPNTGTYAKPGRFSEILVSQTRTQRCLGVAAMPPHSQPRSRETCPGGCLAVVAASTAPSGSEH